MCKIKKLISNVGFALFAYKTPRIIAVANLWIGLLNRFLQLAIIAFILGFSIIYKKGYQEKDSVMSALTTKVKGIGNTFHRKDLPEHYRGIWDPADYVIPSQENNAMFVMTNAVITSRQSPGNCPEDTLVNHAFCNPEEKDACKEGKEEMESGARTGKCVTSLNPIPGRPETNYTCEIEGWCPAEHDERPGNLKTMPLLPEAENFTVLIKNFITFPKFNKTRRNIIFFGENVDKIDLDKKKEKLRKCRQNRTDPHCPIIRLGYMTEQANVEFSKIAVKGGVMNVDISWNCDLDYNIEECLPHYSYSRLDKHDAKIAPGWNFRFSKQYRQNETLYRDLYKVYGILFIFTVHGTAGRFSFVPLMLNIGSGIALLALANLICDFVLLNLCCTPTLQEFFKEKKILTVADDKLMKISNDSKTIAIPKSVRKKQNGQTTGAEGKRETEDAEIEFEFELQNQNIDTPSE